MTAEPDLEALIVDIARELTEHQEIDATGEIHSASRLYGDGGSLDSLNLVRLVVAVEQAIEDAYGVSVGLADDKAMSQTRSPYRTVTSLAAYARRQLAEETAGG